MGTKKKKSWHTLKVDGKTYQAIHKLAEKRGQSMSQVIISLIEKHNA